MTTDLTPLIDRVRAAEGADREIDGAISAALAEPSKLGHQPWPVQGGYVYTDDGGPPQPGRGRFDRAPRYTASVDEALRLVEAKLPGWRRQFFELETGWCARLISPTADIVATDRKAFLIPGFPTPALAILWCLLTALTDGGRDDG